MIFMQTIKLYLIGVLKVTAEVKLGLPNWQVEYLLK